MDDQEHMLNWLNSDHWVFHEGRVIGSTIICPGARSIIERFQQRLDVSVNTRATEPSWEAWLDGIAAFENDPNIAIAVCFKKWRQAGKTSRMRA